MSGFRKHGRTLVRCSVKIKHDSVGDIEAETRDISETGVFVRCKDMSSVISVGDEVEAKLYSDCEKVTVAHLKVVRITNEGVGFAY